MAVALSNIRDLLLPGLQANVDGYALLKEQLAAQIFKQWPGQHWPAECAAESFYQSLVESSFTLEEINEAEEIIRAAHSGTNP